jgi:hypothetical protein
VPEKIVGDTARTDDQDDDRQLPLDHEQSLVELRETSVVIGDVATQDFPDSRQLPT